MRWMKAAALACVILIAGCGGAASRFASHMDRGRVYFAKGDFTHASIEFRNAMQIAPKDTTARLMQGHALEKLGQLREAAGMYQSAVDAAPDNLEARASLGHLYEFVGAYDRALATIAPALTKHPDEASLLTVRAAARMHTKDEAGAVADADHALRVAPTNEDAVAIRAAIYQKAGDLAQAINLVSAAVQKNPASTDLRQVLTQLYVTAEQPAKAEEQLRALVKLKPAELRFRQLLAVFYARTHKLDEAQQTLEDAVKALPNSNDAKLLLVSFIGSQRTREQGEKILRDFVAQEPENYDLRFGLAELLQRNGDTKGAIDTYNEVVRRNGTGAKGLIARDRIAVIAVAQGRDEDARKLADEVLRQSPRDDDALLVRGELELKRRDSVAAIADLRAVLSDQPRSVPIQRMLARAFQANGQRNLAEQALRSALDVAPKDVTVRIDLADLMLATQRPDEAIALLEEGVRNSPTDAQAREVLIKAYLTKRDFSTAHKAALDLATLRPDAAMGPYMAGVAAQGLNQLDEAQKQFERAMALDPHSFETVAALAHVELARGQGAQAITLVKTATEQDPRNARPFNLLGELYLAQKIVPAATEALTTATTLEPAWWLPYRNLALAKFVAKDVPGAIAAYEAGINAAPAEAQLVAELGSLYEGQQRIADAIEVYEQWNKRNPQVQSIANNLAMLLVTYKTDRASLDRARDLAAAFAFSNDGSLLDTYGWVHFKREEYADALPVLEKAAERAPGSKEIRYHLGMAELQAGHGDRARTDLEAALAGPGKFLWSDDARKALASLKS